MKIRSRFIFRNSGASLLLALFATTLHAGSLWREGVTDERGMFADKRAKRVGDIVTIIVQEKTTLDTALNTKTNKESKAGIEGFASNFLNQVLVGLPNTILGKSALKSGTANSLVIPSAPSLPVSGANSFNGGGQIQNSQAITARAAVQVIDVLPNGNLVVEGLRAVSYSKENQFVSIRGIIRPYDIQPDNTVLSTNVANAEIKIVSEGVLTDSQRKGWLLKINERYSPF